MENFDKLNNDNFMSEMFGLEDEYGILNKQAKVCIKKKLDSEIVVLIHNLFRHFYIDHNNLIFLNQIIDPRRD